MQHPVDTGADRDRSYGVMCDCVVCGRQVKDPYIHLAQQACVCSTTCASVRLSDRVIVAPRPCFVCGKMIDPSKEDHVSGIAHGFVVTFHKGACRRVYPLEISGEYCVKFTR